MLKYSKTSRIPAVFLLLAAMAVERTADAQPARSSADMVEVTVEPSVDRVPAGSSFAVAVVLDIQQGWKLNSHRPTLEYLIGTELSVEPQEGLVIDATVYPDGKLLDLDFADQPLSVYEGEVPIFLQMRSDPSLAPGRYELQGLLRVQACSDHVCLAPSRKPVTIPVEVVEAGAESTAIHAERFRDFDPGFRSESNEFGVVGDSGTVDGGTAGNRIAAMIDERGWILAFAGIFLMGLALNLTPCVYPMLSITVSLFSHRGKTQPGTGRSFAMAALYVAGIVTMYTALGVAAAFTGALFGNWLQSPAVLAGIGMLFFLLALSMFGLYELQVPAALTERLGGAQQVAGPLGLYLSGLVVGVFAAPCIGPPIIALLAYVGARGEAWFAFFAFFLLSLGLGFPYLLLGTFSGLVTNLPKSGEWMVWVKKVFGVMLVGLGLFYFALAFRPSLAAWTLPAALLVGGIYLGFLERSGNRNPWFARLKWGVGTAAVVGGLFAIQNLRKEGIEWEPYSDQRVAEARDQGRPVMLDFYADWCLPCQELDRFTFTDERVIEATEHFVRLKVDLTDYQSPEAEGLRQRYEVAGVPTIVFLGSDGRERPEARVVGFLRPEPFLDHVARVN